MEGANGGFLEDLSAPKSREAADLEESMRRLMISSSSPANTSKNASERSSTSSSSLFSGNSLDGEVDFDGPGSCMANPASSSSGASEKGGGLSEDAINQVDQFLREALQNPRERLSILRMEQDVEEFIRDLTQQQLEFRQLPTSYLRLAAHRVAQHYFLQSMVLLENNLPDGSGTSIIVRKTSSECRFPRIRLADIPVNIPQEDGGVFKLAIKQRPHKHSPTVYNANIGSIKANESKSVEERKEEYNRARARIFNSGNHSGSSSAKPENETKPPDSFSHGSVGLSKFEDKPVPGSSDVSSRSAVTDSSTGSSRSARSRNEKDPVGRYRYNNRVAIFRDREVDRKDPDYDRSYERYTQRFDPGFGVNAGPYTIQPMYAPALNYNTEFPQLASATHRPQVSTGLPCPIPPHLPGPWASPSSTAGIGYGHPETMMTPYLPNHVSASARTTSTIYLQPPHYPCQQPGMPLIHPQEHLHQPYFQTFQQQHNVSTLGLARPH